MKKSPADILRDRLTNTHLTNKCSENKNLNLDQIGGIDYLKNDISNKIYNVLFCREKYTQLNANPPKTLLIYGINGVGKKFIINCFSKQYKVPILQKFLDSPLEIREIFRKSATLEKSIILIDNFDFISEEKSMIFQLKESILNCNWNCLIIFINKDTNIPIKYDNEIFVKIPNLNQRSEIFNTVLKNVKTFNIDFNKLAYLTPGFVPENIIKLIGMATTKAIDRINNINNMSDNNCNIDTNINNNIFNINNNISNISNNMSSNAIQMDDFLKSIKDWKNIEQLVTFDDIGGLEDIKEELKNSIFLPSQYPEKFIKFGINKPSGILLYGPPGCGKTLIAKAVANMSHCNFLSIKGPELITKYVGDSERHLRELFEKAKNLSPCVLFFDEIDSLCGKRGKNEFGNRIVNQILTLLDGMEDRGEVYLIGATNRIKSIDEALMRPGRFDKIIEVPLPCQEQRIKVFEKCVKDLPISSININEFDLTGFSSADIAGFVKEAAVLCLRENFESENIFITQEYFNRAVEKFRKMKESKKKH